MSEIIDLLTEIKELHQLVKAGKINREDASLQEKLLKRRAEAIRDNIRIAMFGYPNGGRPFLNSLERKGISNETEVIPFLPAEIEHQRVLCPISHMEMTRGECLERSGEEQHYEDCKGCEIGSHVKKLLTPPIQEHV